MYHHVRRLSNLGPRSGTAPGEVGYPVVVGLLMNDENGQHSGVLQKREDPVRASGLLRSLSPDGELVGVLLGHLDGFEVIRTPVVVDVEWVDHDRLVLTGHLACEKRHEDAVRIVDPAFLLGHALRYRHVLRPDDVDVLRRNITGNACRAAFEIEVQHGRGGLELSSRGCERRLPLAVVGVDENLLGFAKFVGFDDE